MPFRERFYNPQTLSVVKAQVLSISNPCSGNQGGVCESPADDNRRRLFKLSLIETFKNCGPMSAEFYATSKVGECGEVLQKDGIYLLNLPAPVAEDSESTGHREIYKITTCDQNILWSAVKEEQQYFLSESSKELEFMCES